MMLISKSLYKSSIYTMRIVFFQRSIIITFLLAYLYEVIRRLSKNLLDHTLKLNFDSLPRDMWEILSDPLKSNRLPIFLARLIATLNALNPLMIKLLMPYIDGQNIQFVSTFLAGAISALVNFPNFQTQRVETNPYYTFNWTMVLLFKALDSCISSLSSIAKISPQTDLCIDLALLMASIYCVMNAWYFSPEKLEPSYRKWLNKMSHTDEDLLQGLRYMRDGSLDYQHTLTTTTPTAPLQATLPLSIQHASLQNQNHFMKFAQKYGQDAALGDLTTHKKLPCIVFHQFHCESCVKNTQHKFYTQLKTTLKLYASINLFVFVVVKKFYANPMTLILKTLRSSLILSSFTTLQCACICLVRNYHPKNIKDQKYWDLMAPKLGAAIAGIGTVFSKNKSDLLLAIAPRSLGTFFDPKPTDSNLKLQTVLFSFSFAVLVAYGRLNPSRLKGTIGKGFGYMIK